MYGNKCSGALTVHDIEQVSVKDPDKKALRDAIKSDEWKDLPQYKHMKNEPSGIGKLVLRGTRIVIPPSMRKTVLELGHVGHQGIVKTKARLD